MVLWAGGAEGALVARAARVESMAAVEAGWAAAARVAEQAAAVVAAAAAWEALHSLRQHPLASVPPPLRTQTGCYSRTRCRRPCRRPPRMLARAKLRRLLRYLRVSSVAAGGWEAAVLAAADSAVVRGLVV